MAFDQDQIDELKTCHPEIAAVEDGGTEFILIRNLKLPDGCNPQVVDALLCPSPRSGYSSRLFLSSQVTTTVWAKTGMLLRSHCQSKMVGCLMENKQRLLEALGNGDGSSTGI